MMHICLISHDVFRGDGQARVNFEIVGGLVRAGHRVTVVSNQIDPDLRGMVEWIHVDTSRATTNLLRARVFAAGSTNHLRGQSGLVHANGFATWAPSDVNTAHFVHSAWLHSSHHTVRHRRDFYGAYQWLYTGLNARWERESFRRTKVVVAVSDKIRQELISAAGVNSDKVRVIRNGVDPDEFSPRSLHRADLGLPESAFLLFFAGDLRVPRKNLDTVLRAMALLDGVQLAVAGDTAGSPYPALARRLGVFDRVTFLGFRRDIADLMATSDAFVFPSHYEADTLVLREAMAAALPVVTAASVGGADLVDHGVTGFVLADESNVVMLAEHVRWLRDHHEEAKEMGCRARAIVSQHSWRHMVQQYIALYEEIYEGKSLRTR